LKVDELEAVDILANNYKILLMPGYPFGAPGYLRLSYGSLEPSRALEAVDKLKHGIEYLMKLSTERKLIIKDL
jgi:aspartate/methionine/tyrosine aminotransferase